jgi:hypothetical protein
MRGDENITNQATLCKAPRDELMLKSNDEDFDDWSE